MPNQTKIFRVFVSSTFTDMKEERSLLQKYVFPRLERYCLRNHARFQGIDLRWGINEKTQLNQKTLATCLNEVARCQKISPKPNFLILLGDKYGWQPIPEKIPQEEMDLILPLLSDDQKKLLYWDEKNDYYRGWYRLDTNAIQPEYVLQERKDKFEIYDKWEPVEKKIRKALREAVDQLDFSDKKRIKYFTSATHQEIIKGALHPPENIEDPNKHVFAFERVVKNLPDDVTAEGYIDLNGTKRDEYSVKQLERLKVGKDGKSGLKARLEDHYITYDAEWIDGKIEIDRPLKYFAAKVYCYLKSIIAEQIDNVINKDELQHEITLHENFKNKLVTQFRGRKEPLESISRYINDQNNKTLSIIGESGCGKSSVMAKAIQLIIKQYKDDSTVIVYRFLGTSSNSSNIISLMQSVGEQIASEFNTDLKTLVGEGKETSLNEMYGMSETFKKCLALATWEKPIFVFLDALDQLSDTDNAKALNWLPNNLSENVKIIISSLPELESRLQDTSLQKLPLLPNEEAKIILENWLDAIKRTLTDKQLKYIMNKPKITLAIYLKLAFEQVKNWHSYHQDLNISETVEGMIIDFVENLEDKNLKGFVEKVISYMLCGRYSGLAEHEILDVLVSDKKYWEVFLKFSHPDHRDELKKSNKIPLAVWSKLFLDLEPFLTERDVNGMPIITFFHRLFVKVLKEKYSLLERNAENLHTTISKKVNSHRYHDQLSNYFRSMDYFLESIEKQRLQIDCFPPKPRLVNHRKVAELFYQYQSKLLCTPVSTCEYEQIGEVLVSLISNIFYLEAKAEAGMIFDLYAEFDLFLKSLPLNSFFFRIFELLKEAIGRDIQFISTHPTTLFQCLWNSCWWYDCPELDDYIEKGYSKENTGLYRLLEAWYSAKYKLTPGFLWLRSLRPPPNPLMNGYYTIIDNDNTINISFNLNGDIVSLSKDGSKKTWSVTTGQLVDKELATKNSIKNFAIPQEIIQKEKMYDVSFGDEYGEIRSTKNPNEISGFEHHSYDPRLYGHKASVSSWAFSPDSEYLAIGFTDGSVQVRQTSSGLLKKSYSNPFGEVQHLAISIDKKLIASSSQDSRIALSNLDGMEESQYKLLGHSKEISFALSSPFGKYLVTLSRSTSVWLWNIYDGKLRKRFDLGLCFVEQVIFSFNEEYLFASTFPLVISSTSATGAELELKGSGLRIFNTKTLHVTTIFRFPVSNAKAVSCCCRSAFAAAGESGRIFLWTDIDGYKIIDLKHVKIGDNTYVRVEKLMFDKKGKYLDVKLENNETERLFLNSGKDEVNPIIKTENKSEVKNNFLRGNLLSLEKLFINGYSWPINKPRICSSGDICYMTISNQLYIIIAEMSEIELGPREKINYNDILKGNNLYNQNRYDFISQLNPKDANIFQMKNDDISCEKETTEKETTSQNFIRKKIEYPIIIINWYEILKHNWEHSPNALMDWDLKCIKCGYLMDFKREEDAPIACPRCGYTDR